MIAGCTEEELFSRAVGLRIRAARRRAGLKQGELADLAGLKQGVVTQLETGRRGPRLWELFLISSAFDLPMFAFVPGDPSPLDKEKGLEADLGRLRDVAFTMAGLVENMGFSYEEWSDDQTGESEGTPGEECDNE